MSSAGYHWMCAVRIALARCARMNVDIGDNCETPLFTMPPELPEVTAIERHDPSVQAFGVEVVVEFKAYNTGATIPAVAKEEGTAFSRAASPPNSELSKKPMPEEPRAR